MNPLIELNLTLILFLPWFAILGTLYWMFPRRPRGAVRVVYDIVALAASAALFLWSVHWSMANADAHYGRLWPQILATALGYGVFLAAIGVAFGLRHWLIVRRR
jgi:TRAP-type C4-dicarboxylate transport system permease small subunit